MLTPNCAITINGIFYPIEFRYESYEFGDQLKKLQSIAEEGEKMNRSETTSTLKNLASNRQVDKYIFDKYTIPIGDETTNNEETDKFYSEVLVFHKLSKHDKGEGERKLMNDLIMASLQPPRCENVDRET